MKHLISFVIVFCVLVLQLNSIKAQGKFYLSFDQDLSFNLPLHHYVKYYSTTAGTTIYEIFQNYSKLSYSGKITLDTRILNKNIISLYLVSGIGYTENKKKFRESTKYSGCFRWGKIEDSVNIVNKSIVIPLGLKMNKAINKFTISGSILLNPMLQFRTKSNKYDFITGTYTVTNRNLTYLRLFLSGQFSLQYKLSQNFTLGPSLEIYSHDLLLQYDNIYPTKYLFINPGVRFSLLLK